MLEDYNNLACTSMINCLGCGCRLAMQLDYACIGHELYSLTVYLGDEA